MQRGIPAAPRPTDTTAARRPGKTSVAVQYARVPLPLHRRFCTSAHRRVDPTPQRLGEIRVTPRTRAERQLQWHGPTLVPGAIAGPPGDVLRCTWSRLRGPSSDIPRSTPRRGTPRDRGAAAQPCTAGRHGTAAPLCAWRRHGRARTSPAGAFRCARAWAARFRAGAGRRDRAAGCRGRARRASPPRGPCARRRATAQ